MALVQALPVTDHSNPGVDVQQRQPLSSSRSPPASRSSANAMGSVSSLISGRTYQERHCRAASEFAAKARRSTPATSCFRLQDNTLRSASSLEQLLVICNQTQERHPQAQVLPPPLPTKKQPRPGNSAAAGGGGGTTASATGGGVNNNLGYVSSEVVAGDWNDNLVAAAVSPCSDSEDPRDNRTLNGNIGGPPPKLIPVSGQLEKNMEKVLIRPTAFKPVVPKNRHLVHYLSPRPAGCSLSESQGSLNLLLPLAGSTSGANAATSGSSALEEKRDSFSGGRNARSSQSCSMSDSGRNSLSSLPTHSSTGYSLAPSEGSSSGSAHPEAGQVLVRNTSGGIGIHGHSDSGRSSSSKSTGSGSRGQPLSDSGSCGHSSPPVEGYEVVVRDLEEKLRERDMELQHLRENLDENEAAICQVYEEKQHRCEREMEELRQNCATKMKQASQKAQRTQQVLQLQVFQLQQEKKKLQEDFSSLLQDREMLERRCANIQREQTQLGPRLEETKWEVCQKSGEISLLKQQLKEIQSELSQKAGDIVVLRAQLREARSELQASQARSQEAQAAVRTRSLELEVCENELQRRKSEAELLREKVSRLEEEMVRLRDSLTAGSVKAQCTSLTLYQGRGVSGRGGPSPCAYRDVDDCHAAWGGESDEAKALRQNAETLLGLKQQVDRLKAELMYERRTSEEQLSRFQDERTVWQEEKAKVICYQKQLQQNYIQMYRRNRDLERVMRELSLELENRDMDDYEVHSGSNDIHFEEITATEI
ncbi:leucine zipper putative tumor suppressor 2 homolog [Phyllopteryx taeniolatus]|uniref:leucine zipper putative tumor suppressor 2 homolog n=1 Tax=Phyllopteryx taeniolatus TaxID=161469 RepID=UPI002AD212D3|nr:leucine zipper putative tumor suppressor 2 homolog [Phyllopteryx taeniolatus]XP_061647008.1 leucine zipper putative tumor suppressor 2 homolog [Phyllopteryx taeniolatus]XP_061647009.1 leucine zipper putative tumor suppressor 2 homolog [Phyllopteryx taeniolatus]